MEDLMLMLHGFIDNEDILNDKVSKSGTYWHADHSLRVIKGICKSLIASNPDEYSSKFSPSWAAIKTSGVIPRGLGKAPKAVTTKDDISQEFLIKQIEAVEALLDQIKSLPKKAHFEHPYFGSMDLKNAQKFLKIHTKHHIKIINAILK